MVQFSSLPIGSAFWIKHYFEIHQFYFSNVFCNKFKTLLIQDTFVLPAMENIVSPGMSRDMQTRQEHIPTTLNMDLLEATEEDLLDVAARKGSVL